MSVADKSTEQLLDEAIAHHKQGRYGEAEELYRDVLELDPDHADANNLLGLIGLELGHAVEAVELFDKATRLVPGSAMFRTNYADALRAAQRIPEAIAMYRVAQRFDPDSFAAHYNLGMLLIDIGNKKDATACMRAANRIDPSHGGAKHLAAALSGVGRPKTAPADYVAGVFDKYAASFDEHLQGALRYDTPAYLLARFKRLAGKNTKPAWIVVDLGCGTGLCGALFRPLAATLVGSDLSGGMLEQAAAKQVYDELHQEDLVATLARYDGAIDVALAADVFVYVGELGPTFAAAAAALRPGGRLAFSIEDADDKRPYILRSSGRFAHSLRGIEAIARDNGFAIEWMREIAVRRDGDSEIAGHLIIARKPLSPAAAS